ncbi:sigma-54-dependent transcriptional regulator [Geoalkalibacter sp.]|uniref:sigma-54-dependent transcriptional regulator n=1 Tax=Geoalkalibacter sp. TaxID=3041440 RepID=UPI00272DE2C0|nr:sigma-54 dependent transcriptional regulator [Geoalkalibacter sp.]
MPKKKMLVIDDDPVIRRGLKQILEKAGYEVEIFASGHTAVEELRQAPCDLVITDLKMPGMSGLEVLRTVSAMHPEVPIVLITGYSTVETAVEAMKNGAVDYIAKPFTPDELLEKVQQALEKKAVLFEDLCLRKELRENHGFQKFIGQSQEMQKVYRRILQVAPTDSTVLITGESGTGKELVARAIHQNSQRRGATFVAVDCTALAENLLESELFGHVRGSFTGAIQTKTGLFKVADGGTLFLDEISNLSLKTQAKLLRVLQEREITPIGGTQSVPVNIRLVAATNRGLKEMVAAGLFREDLFFRLNIIPVDLPPLRERKGDLRLLIAHFLKLFGDEMGKEVRGLAPDALDLLEAYPFPGNVRELENIIERAVVLAQGEFIQREDLELNVESAPDHPLLSDYVPQRADELKERKRQIRERVVEPLERAFLIQALKRNDWNITKAADEVGMQRPNFHALLKKQGIEVKRNLLGEEAPPPMRSKESACRLSEDF